MSTDLAIDPALRAGLLKLSRDQRAALLRLRTNIQAGRSTILTGPGGSGKTTLVRLLCMLWECDLLATTNKAASVLTATTRDLPNPPKPARTIHKAMTSTRVFESAKIPGALVRRASNDNAVVTTWKPQERTAADVVVMDEMSMAEATDWTHYQRYAAGRPVVIVGDKYQLGPVGGGKSAMEIEGLDVVELTECHRQESAELRKVCNEIRLARNDDYALGCLVRKLPRVARNDLPAMIADGWQVIEGRHARIHQTVTAYRESQGWPTDDLVEGEKLLVTKRVTFDGEKALPGLEKYNVVTFKGWVAEAFTVETAHGAGDVRMARVWSADAKKEHYVLITLRDVELGLDEAEVDTFRRDKALEDGARDAGYAALSPLVRGRQLVKIMHCYPAYSITCHIAQGAGFDRVVVCGPAATAADTASFWYVAASRACKELRIAV